MPSKWLRFAASSDHALQVRGNRKINVKKWTETMILREMQKILDAEIIWGSEHLDREIRTCFACDLISEMLLYVRPQSLLVTSLMNAHIIHTAQVMDAIGVVFVGGKRPDKSVIKTGELNGIPLLTTPYLTFECCGRLFASGIQAYGKKPL